MSISKELKWGTEIEMMPGKRAMFSGSKSQDGIFLGFDKRGMFAKVVRCGTSTVNFYNPSFWRPKE